MTDTHYSWHLIPSVFYKRCCRVLWGFFLSAVYSYAVYGYIYEAIAIFFVALLGYLFVSSQAFISNIHFHGGVWYIDALHLKQLKVLRSTNHWLILQGETLLSAKKKRFIVYRDQFKIHQEHEFRWVLNIVNY